MVKDFRESKIFIQKACVMVKTFILTTYQGNHSRIKTDCGHGNEWQRI